MEPFERSAPGRRRGLRQIYPGQTAHSRKDARERQLTRHFAGGAGLEIPDGGSGSGFFACILSEEGRRVTGIDASEGMLERARQNARALGVKPTSLF